MLHRLNNSNIFYKHVSCYNITVSTICSCIGVCQSYSLYYIYNITFMTLFCPILIFLLNSFDHLGSIVTNNCGHENKVCRRLAAERAIIKLIIINCFLQVLGSFFIDLVIVSSEDLGFPCLCVCFQWIFLVKGRKTHQYLAKA